MLRKQSDLDRDGHFHLDHVGRDSFYGFLALHQEELFSDEDFAEFYCPSKGRPSVPPSLLATALLLQVYEGVSDEEAKARADFDLRWKVALGVGLEERPFAKSTLQLFRARLILHESMQTVFQKSLDFARRTGYLRSRRLKVVLDTSYILGRGALKDTYNLLAAGCNLAVWDRTSDRAVVLMLTDAATAENVLFREDGVVAGLPRGSVVINMGTIGADAVEEISAKLDAVGLHFVDAPVAGSTPVAKTGDLDIMVGSREKDFEEFRPVFDTLGKKVTHVGPVGAGTKMKLVNNLVMGTNMAILAEGLALGEASGIPIETQLEVLSAGGASSKVLDQKGENAATGAYKPEFKLSHQLKDLYYALELARYLHDPLPITGLVSQTYLAGMSDHADDDMSAVVETYREGERYDLRNHAQAL